MKPVQLHTHQRRLYWASFAGHAVEALLTIGARTVSPEDIAQRAGAVADALVREMAKRSIGEERDPPPETPRAFFPRKKTR